MARLVRIYEAPDGVRQGRPPVLAARQTTPLATWAGPMGVTLFPCCCRHQGLDAAALGVVPTLVLADQDFVVAGTARRLRGGLFEMRRSPSSWRSFASRGPFLENRKRFCIQFLFRRHLASRSRLTGFCPQLQNVDGMARGARNTSKCCTRLIERRRVIELADANYVHGRNAQGTGLARRIEVRTTKVDRAKSAACIADRFSFTMRGGVPMRDRVIKPLTDDRASANHDRAERLGSHFC